MRRILAAVAILVGIGLVVVTLSYSFFARASGGQHITDRFRTTMSTAGLHQLVTNFGVIKGLGDQFIDQATPAFAHQLSMSTPAFKRFAAANFPAVGRAYAEVPPAIALVGPVNPRLFASHDDFQRVDDIPGLGLGIPAVPWMMVIVAALLVPGGLAALALPRSRLPIAAITIVGVAMIVVPFALSLPTKAAAAARIVKVSDVALSRTAATTATETVALLNALVPEVQTKVVPALAQRLHTTPAKLGAAIARDYPDVARGLREWPSIAPSAEVLSANQRASVAEAAAMDGLPFRALPWFVIGPGIVLTAVGAVALRRPPRPAPQRREPLL